MRLRRFWGWLCFRLWLALPLSLTATPGAMRLLERAGNYAHTEDA